MSTLGTYLKAQGFDVDDHNVPYGRTSTWKGVTFLMVHHTVSKCTGSEADIANYCRNGGSGTYPPLCQIVLGNSGKVWMTSKERDGQKDPGRASHAGNGKGYGVAKDSMNEHALGIECQCDGSHKLATHTHQYNVLIQLLAALVIKYDVPVKNIIGHKEWSTTGKVDPRDNMDTIRADVTAELAETASGDGPYVTGDVWRSKCGFGEPTNGDTSSATVKELQSRLNRITLEGGQTLEITGRYDIATDEEVRLWQEQICGDTQDPVLSSYLGPLQFAEMFPDAVYTLHDDGDPAVAGGSPEIPEPPVITEPDPGPPIELPPTIDLPESITFPLGIQYHYSGKPSGSYTFRDSYKRLDVASWAPRKDGLTLGMLYANVDGEGEFRTRLIRENPDDATAYQTHYAKAGDNYLLTHVWFEKGEADRPLHYEFSSVDGTTHTVTTRYAKFVTIPWDVTVILQNAFKALEAVSSTLSSAYSGVMGLLGSSEKEKQ